MSRHRIHVERGLYRDGSTYYACATPAGSRNARWKSLGEVGVMQARRLRDEFAADVRQGRARARMRDRQRASFAAVAKEWLNAQRALVEVGELAPRTLDGYELSVRRHLLPFFGRDRSHPITPTGGDGARTARNGLVWGPPPKGGPHREPGRCRLLTGRAHAR